MSKVSALSHRKGYSSALFISLWSRIVPLLRKYTPGNVLQLWKWDLYPDKWQLFFCMFVPLRLFETKLSSRWGTDVSIKTVSTTAKCPFVHQSTKVTNRQANWDAQPKACVHTMQNKTNLSKKTSWWPSFWPDIVHISSLLVWTRGRNRHGPSITLWAPLVSTRIKGQNITDPPNTRVNMQMGASLSPSFASVIASKYWKNVNSLSPPRSGNKLASQGGLITVDYYRERESALIRI